MKSTGFCFHEKPSAADCITGNGISRCYSYLASRICIGLFISGLCNFSQKLKLFFYFISSELLPHKRVLVLSRLLVQSVKLQGPLCWSTENVPHFRTRCSPTTPPTFSDSAWGQSSLATTMTFPPSPQWYVFPTCMLHMPYKGQIIFFCAGLFFRAGLEAVNRSLAWGLLHGGILWHSLAFQSPVYPFTEKYSDCLPVWRLLESTGI